MDRRPRRRWWPRYHFCMTAAVVDRTKNGRPIDTNSVPQQPQRRAARVPEVATAATAMGSTISGSNSSSDVHHDVSPNPEILGRAVRVGVADQQHGLEEDEAGVPDRRRPAEAGQQNPRDHRLHEEHEKGAHEQRGRKKPHESTRSSALGDGDAGCPRQSRTGNDQGIAHERAPTKKRATSTGPIAVGFRPNRPGSRRRDRVRHDRSDIQRRI